MDIRMNFQHDAIFHRVIDKLKKTFNVDFQISFFLDMEDYGSFYNKEKDGLILGTYNKQENVIYVNREYGIAVALHTICHEIHHKIMMDSERLVYSPGKAIFDGQEYDFDMETPFTPWEVEAENKAEEYFQLLMKELDKQELAYILMDMKKERIN